MKNVWDKWLAHRSMCARNQHVQLRNHQRDNIGIFTSSLFFIYITPRRWKPEYISELLGVKLREIYKTRDHREKKSLCKRLRLDANTLAGTTLHNLDVFTMKNWTNSVVLCLLQSINKRSCGKIWSVINKFEIDKSEPGRANVVSMPNFPKDISDRLSTKY